MNLSGNTARLKEPDRDSTNTTINSFYFKRPKQ